MKSVAIVLAALAVIRASAGPLQWLSRADASFVPTDSYPDHSTQPILSADGRFVLFASTANNLAFTTNGPPLRASRLPWLNVYLRDRASNTTTLVSMSQTGNGGGDADSYPTGISTNGQFVLFESLAGNLVPRDTNNASDVFIRDMVNSTTTLVSVNTKGVSGINASSSSVMSPDGRFVAFNSYAWDLVVGDTNFIFDVFVRDLQSHTTVCASKGAISTGGAVSSLSDAPAISSNGRYVAFYSSATNLVAGVQFAGEIYIRNLVGSNTVWASAEARTLFNSVAGTSNAVSCSLSLSADGNYVAFETGTNSSDTSVARGIILRYNLATSTTDLISTNGYMPAVSYENIQDLSMTPDGRFVAFVAKSTGTNTAIYLWDALDGTNTLVSVDTNNALPAAMFCDSPSVSSDGRFVAFVSDAGTLTTNITSAGWHLYLRNMQTGTTVLLDADTNGAASGVDVSAVPILSADGQLIAFESSQNNLVTNDFNNSCDVFLRDNTAGTTELISARHPLLPSLAANGHITYSPQPVSADGRYLAFASDSDNLVPGDTNQLRDVFVRDLFAGTNFLVSVANSGTSASDGSFEPAISGNGRYVAFTSAATNLVSSDTNNFADVFVRDLQNNNTTLVSVNSAGTGVGNQDSYSAMIGSDGRFILFLSKASNLTAGNFGGTENLFLRDRQAGATYALTTNGLSRFSMTPDGCFVAFTETNAINWGRIVLWDAQLAKRIGTNSTPRGIQELSISPDGNRIAYFAAYLAGYGTPSLSVWNRAANQVSAIGSGYSGSHAGLRFSADSRFLVYSTAPTPDGTNQIYLYDFQSQTSSLVSHVANFTFPANDSSDSPDISADGRFVVFRSAAGNLVTGDSNGVPDVFLFDSVTGTNTLLSAGIFDGTSADNRSFEPMFSGDGRMIVFRSWASDLAAGDFNQASDIFAFAFLYASITTANGGAPTISWPATPDQTYSVEFKDDLGDSVWHPLSATVTIAGNRASLIDWTLTSGRRFYRVVSGN